jgi:hypothetical protein
MLRLTLAHNQRIHDSGLKTKNYDKGMNRFIHTFDPDVEMSATVAAYICSYVDHGWGVYCTQEIRRCLLLDTVYVSSAEEAFWTALSTWAAFQPRAAMPRKEPGRVFYPNDFFHVVEKYWHYLHCLDQHPDFSNHSDYCQHMMAQFSQAISGVPRLDEFQLKPLAEADEAGTRISEEAAISRLRPIQDGLDY